MRTLANPQPPRAARRSNYDRDMAEVRRVGARLLKEAGAGRTAVCSGPHLIGEYPPDALEAALADLVRWAVEPGYFPALPSCCDRAWTFDAGEELALWRSGRVVAIVRKAASGRAVVTRLDGR